MKVIDLGNLMDRVERTEGELYHEANQLADRLDEVLAGASAFEDALQKLSEKIDQVKTDLAKVQFAVEVRNGPIPREG